MASQFPVVYPLLSNDNSLCYGNLVIVYKDTKDIDNVIVDYKIFDFGQNLNIE